jgi:molybdopterin/thiamine biosynthesis adenylyltransferase
MKPNDVLLTRYAKQMKVHTIGSNGQQQLANTACAIIGAGALGAAVAEQLVRAGIGYVRIIDRDFVELSNLHRQTLYTEQDAEHFLPKAIAAGNALKAINSTVEIDPIIADVHSGNIHDLLHNIDIIVDGSDNFTIRYLLNDYCVANNKTWVYGAVTATSGTTTTFTPQQTPCFRCLFPDPPELGVVDTCDTVGVLAPIVTMVAAIQATEVIKFASGHRSQLNRQLLQLDCWSLQFFKLEIAHAINEQCPCCKQAVFSWLNQQEQAAASSICGRQTIQLTLSTPLTHSFDELAKRFAASYPITQNRYLLKLHYSEQISVIFFPDHRIMIQGTEDLYYANLIVNKILQI